MPRSESTSPPFLHPASGALILGLDWVLFSENAMTLGLSTPLVVLVGFGGTGLATGLIQHVYHDDGLGKAVLKGLLAGLAVGIPLPVAGTAVGGGILALSGLNTLWGRSEPEKTSPPASRSENGH
ncbi:MAG: phosphoribosylaminoimidazole carboxylase [Bacteroidetes bacterium QS_3_64_15]|nr:MAG: phosphoribosylaminoimidazole carboxylase [Bacteroidetes bacterium QS_3_64_15]